LSYPPKKHHVLFINPTLSGLFTAWMTKQLGADVGIITEINSTSDAPDSPAAFPHLGTWNPEAIDRLAIDTGFAPPKWERFTKLTIKAVGTEINLNSDDGPGGLLLTLTRQFTHCRSIITEWLTPHIEKGGKIRDGNTHLIAETSGITIATELDNLYEKHKHIPCSSEIEKIRVILDTLSILTTGTCLTETDSGSLPVIFSRFLSGWHTPSGRDKNWSETITHRLIENDIGFYDVVKIESFDLVNKSLTRVSTIDGHIFDAHVIAVPESSRFQHPAAVSPSTLIIWTNIPCDITNAFTDYENLASTGTIRKDPDRPPINDNFVSWFFNPDEKCLALSAPIELRFLRDNPDRLAMMVGNIVDLASSEAKFELQPVSPAPSESSNPLVLPGQSVLVTIPDQPAYGTDLVSRMVNCRAIADTIAQDLSVRLNV